MAFFWTKVQLLKVNFRADEDLTVQFFPSRTEHLLQKTQYDIFRRLLLLILLFNHFLSCVFKCLIVLAHKSNEVRTDIDEFLQLGLILGFILGELHGLEEVLVEVGEFVDEVRIYLEDDVEISNAFEDQCIEEID